MKFSRNHSSAATTLPRPAPSLRSAAQMNVRFQACEKSTDHGVTTQAGGLRNTVCVDSRNGLVASGTGTETVPKPAAVVVPTIETTNEQGERTPTSRN